MADARLLFDACAHLVMHAQFVHSPPFEFVVMKLQKELSFYANEQEALGPFETVGNAVNTDGESLDDFALIIFRRVKRQNHSLTTVYDPLLQHIRPTSNTSVRLFSSCQGVSTDLRSSMVPSIVEALMFLRANLDM